MFCWRLTVSLLVVDNIHVSSVAVVSHSHRRQVDVTTPEKMRREANCKYLIFLLLMGCLNNAWSVEIYSVLSGGKKASAGT